MDSAWWLVDGFNGRTKVVSKRFSSLVLDHGINPGFHALLQGLG